MSLFSELKRRNVLRVALAYLAASWLLIQIVETLFPIFGLANALIRVVAILLGIGFPAVLIFSWLYELTPEGLKLERDVVTRFTKPEEIVRTVIEATGSDAKVSDYDKDLPAKGIAYYAEHMDRIINALQLPYAQAVADIKKIKAEMAADAKKKPEAVLMAVRLTPAKAKKMLPN